MKRIIQIALLLLLISGTVNAQDTEKKKAKNQKSKYTLAFMPAITIPEEGFSHYSVGYGFNLNASYKLTEDISLSGNIEIIFPDFKYTDMFDGRADYTVTSHWYSLDIGPKFFLNRGSARIYINSNFKYTLIYHGENKDIGLLNPEPAIGFSFGFGLEIPVNDNFKIEVSPVCNLLYPINYEGYSHTLSSYSTNAYYKISFGLNYNL
jgi:hypothetical protein